jgi:serine/threonine protein kinase
VLHQIGVGTLGPVFRTYEPTRDRLVAVKVFRLDIVPEQAQVLADELSRSTEAGLFHPSIVEPIAAGMEGTVAYRAEEYVAAESLDVAMRHYAPAPIDKILPFITQLAGAIDFARATGVGHGGLHPRDIFVTPDEARATGFGVVEALERAGIRAPVRRPYTAPERIERGEWGTPADVFSLAAITFELLTGRRPAGTGTQIGALSDTGGRVAAAIHSVLARAMNDDPSVRYPNALAFAGALEGATRASEATVTPVTPVPVPSDDRRVPTLGEFAVEKQLDPVQRAIDDLATETTRAGAAATPSLFDASEEHMATAGRHDRSAVDVPLVAPSSLERITPHEPVAEPEPEEPATPSLEQAFPSEHAAESFTAAETRLVDRDPSYGVEPDLSEAPERSRPAVLPLAVTLVLGLLAGFAAGYFVGDRDRGPATARDTAAAQPAATTPAQPAASAPAAAAKPYSEQAVASAPPASPPTEVPPTVSEETPAPSANAARPEPTRPAAAAPAVGRLVVRSTPARASVTVNGQWRGRTPLTLEKLPFGRYVVRVVEPGYRVALEEFALNAGTAAHAINVRLSPERAAAPTRAPASARSERPATPAPNTRQSPSSPGADGRFTGALYVDSRPQGASVLLDGKNVGTTPLRLSDVRIGTHVVRLELAEHRPWSSVARVTAGEELRVTGSLERFQ